MPSKDFVRARSERGAALVSSASIYAIADVFFEAISAFNSTTIKRGDAFALDLVALPSTRRVWL